MKSETKSIFDQFPRQRPCEMKLKPLGHCCARKVVFPGTKRETIGKMKPFPPASTDLAYRIGRLVCTKRSSAMAHCSVWENWKMNGKWHCYQVEDGSCAASDVQTHPKLTKRCAKGPVAKKVIGCCQHHHLNRKSANYHKIR